MKARVIGMLFVTGVVFNLGGTKAIDEVKETNMCKDSINYEQGLKIAEDDSKCFRYVEKKEPKYLMIVAHPDDETIYGGGHLLNDKYTVVCITCGQVDYRVNEFKEVMAKTNDDYLMLGFDDRINKTGPISDWSYQYNDIYNKLSEIIKSEDWDLIITHNPNGEYGHRHHILTSEMVTNITGKKNLYYFGHWYRNGGGGERISDDLYNTKINELISVYYQSQGSALNYNYNMLPYENWIKATEW